MKKLLLPLMFAAGLVTGFANDNATKLALARDVISAMQADKMFDSMAGQMKQMASQMAAPPPGATPAQIKILEDFQAKIMDLSMSEAKGMIAKMDQVYADVYTEDELQAIKTFYTSPGGQAMVAKQPQVMQHLMPIVQEMQRGLLPKMQKLAEEMKAEMENAAKPADAAVAK